MSSNQKRNEPPEGASFWELFDHFWRRGLGNEERTDGLIKPWTAETLETAFDSTPSERTIENWQSRSTLPLPENLHKIAATIANGDNALRLRWYDAFIDARLNELRTKPDFKKEVEPAQTHNAVRFPSIKLLRVLTGLALAAIVCAGTWFAWVRTQTPQVENIRICDKHYFDKAAGKCTQHVAVYVHGIDEVFLSFDFKNLATDAPFERWWILNGERQAGRSSFNDDAWPGWTYWRPGTLKVGQYVVRVVVDGRVFTQAFQVQPENFVSE